MIVIDNMYEISFSFMVDRKTALPRDINDTGIYQADQ